ncbi:MerR family transcriptional regulator [Shimazuella sp. AN120528]|nr:MerR family transcriptional regulator [Shimazuella soli]
MEKMLTIQKMSQVTGLSTHTLRYYEKIGLISSIRRKENGYRLYSEADIVWVEFLNRLRAIGMPIQQMQEYAALRMKGDETITQRRKMLEDYNQQVQQQLFEVKQNLSAIQDKIKLYRKMEEEYERSKGLNRLIEGS